MATLSFFFTLFILTAHGLEKGDEVPNNFLSYAAIFVQEGVGYMGSGNLVSENMVLTIADEVINKVGLSVQYGVIKAAETESDIKPQLMVKKVHYFGDKDGIAMAELDGKISDKRLIAKLYPQDAPIPSKKECKLYSFGKTEESEKFETLREVSIKLINSSSCALEVKTDQLCGKSGPSGNVCPRDDGVGLSCPCKNGLALAGILYKTDSCGSDLVFINIKPYMHWIKKTINRHRPQ